MNSLAPARLGYVDSRYARFRLGVSVVLTMIGGVAMWSVVVALPAVQTEFGVARGSAALPYTLTMIGTAVGTVMFGRVVDRIGIVRPLLVAAGALCVGYLVASASRNIGEFALAQGLMGLCGSAVTFGPLMADVSHWFSRRRGTAVSICAAGSYLSGTVWPPVVQRMITEFGWRHTHFCIAVFCLLSIASLSVFLRRQPVARQAAPGAAAVPVRVPHGIPGLSSSGLQTLLCVAGVACCVAMAMPQVHLVAYCGDLGYGPAHGAQMLSLMLACGIVSRIGSGFVADRIGGLRTLLLGSAAQMFALVLYLGFNGLVSLYVVSVLFGLFQGGIVPSYAIIVREMFPAREAGTRIGVVLTATMVGMALGGWMSGVIFDATGSYRAAFANGIAWNALNLGIAMLLLARSGRQRLATA
jgi:MFS family permease